MKRLAMGLAVLAAVGWAAREASASVTLSPARASQLAAASVGAHWHHRHRAYYGHHGCYGVSPYWHHSYRYGYAPRHYWPQYYGHRFYPSPYGFSYRGRGLAFSFGY